MFLNKLKFKFIKLAAINIVLTAVYLLSAKLSLSVAFANASVSPIWPPTGIAIAALLLFGFELWPGIFAGAILVNFITDGNAAVSAGIALGNTLEAVVAVYLIKKFAGGRATFDRIKNVFLFVILGAVLSTMISAFVGATILSLAGLAMWEEYFEVWLTWWLGDMTGAMIVTPILILLFNDYRLKYNWRKRAELTAAFLLLLVACLIIFGPFPTGIENYPLSFLIIPLFIWLALNFSARETAMGTIIVAIFSIWGTLKGFGPYAVGDDPNRQLLIMQSFLAITSIGSLILAAVVSDNNKKSASLIRANRSKDEFLAVLGHELRNPLATVVSNIQLIRLLSANESEIQEASGRIELSLKHMTRLLNELLDIARITSNKITLHKEKIDLKDVVKRSIDTINMTMVKKNHMLKINLPVEPIHIVADPIRVEQIITNLLHNAVKYTEPGGTIALDIKRKKDFISLSVADNGIGIPQDKLQNIFDMYSQFHDQSALRKDAGLGVGLKLSKTLAELHGGHILVNSGGIGKGSLFTVKLPNL